MEVTDGKGGARLQAFAIVVEESLRTNRAPVADAGPDRSINVRRSVVLDGSGSSDVDGDRLSFQWSFTSLPPGSSAMISDPTAVQPSFMVDMAGTYVLQLVVNDGSVNSSPDTVAITTINSRPVADAGPGQSGYVGSTVTLDGSASSDADADPLTYQWSFASLPGESTAALINPTAANPRFTIDRPGVYLVQLVVNDGQLESDASTAAITTMNSRPVAEAGADQNVLIGTIVTLDGAGSKDADNDPLTCRWSFTTVPAGSGASFSNPNACRTMFTPDRTGLYVAQLLVNDGSADSEPDTAAISADPLANRAPAASDDAYTVSEGTTLAISPGVLANDHDPEGDAITAVLSENVARGSLALSANGSFTYTPNPGFTGTDRFTYRAYDGLLYSNVAAATITVNPVNRPPAVNAGPDQTVTLPASASLNGNVSDDGLPNPPGSVSAAWMAVSGPGTVTFGNSSAPSTTAGFSASGAYVLRLAAGDGQYSVSDDVAITVNPPEPDLPPDPSTVAPPLDSTAPTLLSDATAFLYSGPNPIQTGVAPGAIEARRAALLRGRVLNRDGSALPGVQISILSHPEFGRTLSRADGMFDIAVNGGGLLTVDYRKPGLLPAQRQVNVPWLNYAHVDDAILIAQDPRVSAVDLTNTTKAFQAAQGSVVTDQDGTRQATLLIPRGTQARVYNPDGTTRSVTTLNLRLTEYTVGTSGPRSMPAPLPPASAYTYAVELKADEASLKRNGKDVLFDRPVPFYVNNFLNFPVGGVVPVGYYDSDKGLWVPSDNGRVIRVLAINDGSADVDANGDGVADSDASLAALGITSEERAELGNLHTPGQSLWRVPLSHLSTWDCNWPYRMPDDAVAPNNPQPDGGPGEVDDPTLRCGSVIECQNQIVRESLPVTGTGLTLNYSSGRVAGRSVARTLVIQVSGSRVPASLRRIDVVVEVAGRRFLQSLPAQANQSYTFTWDGRDAFGRALTGIVPASVGIGYVYRPIYATAAEILAAFALFSDNPLEGSSARNEIIIWQYFNAMLGGVQLVADSDRLGAWTLSVHHTYEPNGSVLALGNGDRRGVQAQSHIRTIAGNGTPGFSGDSGSATEASLRYPRGVAVGADGSVYIAEDGNSIIRRVDSAGIITTFAGNRRSGDLGDGGLATNATLSYPSGVAVGVDGSVYIAETYRHRIRRVDPSGIISTVAGTGLSGSLGDGGPATSATLSYPYGVAVGIDGSFYIADYNNHKIRRVSPGGTISTVAGSGTECRLSGNGGPATAAGLCYPSGVAVGTDGSIYVADTYNQMIRRIGPDGVITAFAGTGTTGYSGDSLSLTAPASGFYLAQTDPDSNTRASIFRAR